MRRHLFILLCLLCSLLAWGCGTPNKANIELRKQIQQLQGQIADLQRTHEADQAQIYTLQQKEHVPPVPTLPGARLDQLFTVHGLRLGRLTGGVDLDPKKPGDEALQVFAAPQDDSGQDLKAAGAFTIELFDLALPGDQRLGEWHFTTEQSRQHWQGSMLYEYVFTLRWQKVPMHRDLTVKVTFTDELTQRTFTVQKEIKAVPPTAAATQPQG